VGRFGTHYNFRKEGTWSASETGTIASLSSKVATSPLHSDSLNWAYSASYVESGKRFEGISYADGLSMPRQNIGKNNSDSLAIVQVTYYDHQGRPALGTLPAPTNDPNLKYRYKFNRPNANASISYSKADFDKDISSCLATAQSMHTGYGAAYYYSSSNAQTDGFQGYTPDAQGMPFVQIQYTPDGTSRANAIGAAGPDYQLDTDHTTALEYGVPSQDRLNRLFGTDAGWNNQYQANVITDANGQRVVTYIDAHGRVVATALSGESPSNVQALNSNITFATTTQVITPGDQLQDNSTPGTLSYAWNFRADVEGEYTFSYGIYPGSYEDTCLHNLCMDCVYDLNITIIDAACGNTLFNQSKVIGGSTLDTLCNHSGLDSIGTSNIKLNLTPGSYQIIKTLVVN
jgi:hypothetical protein